MAVCGCCWLCGTKFDCTGDDEGALVKFRTGSRRRGTTSAKLCTSCVEAIDGDADLGRNEPHEDGRPRVDRLAEIIRLLAVVAQRREAD